MERQGCSLRLGLHGCQFEQTTSVTPSVCCDEGHRMRGRRG